jgi:hypothetical protein
LVILFIYHDFIIQENEERVRTMQRSQNRRIGRYSGVLRRRKKEWHRECLLAEALVKVDYALTKVAVEHPEIHEPGHTLQKVNR